MRLLLAEDDHELALWLNKALTQSGFTVDCADDGLAADHLLQNENYVVAVLDIAMPRMDGLTVLQRLRARNQGLPVLLLSAYGEVADRVQGLNAGADDYLAKPFEPDELEARLRALLRRSAGQLQTCQQLGQLTYNDGGYFLLRDEPLSLTPREQSLLTALMYRRERPVSKTFLFEQVFNLDNNARQESIELYVHRLRKKLSDSDVRITTLRGLGYILQYHNNTSACTDGSDGAENNKL